jgi:sugar transferase (PEP-CTERM/EpsH1 system associated)
MMMGDILFLSHRIPFPPDRGDKIRSHNILKQLTRIAPVHVATFADDDLDIGEEAELAAVASSYRLVRRSKSLVLAGIEALARKLPVSLTAFHDRAIANYVEEVLATRPIRAIYVFSGQMGQYVPASFKGRVVADFVDVDSAKFEAYAAKKRATGWIDCRESHLLRAEEARLAQRADVSLLISRAEADLFASRLPAGMADSVDIQVLGNGIDSVSFDPALVAPETRMLDCPGPRLIFTGQMDYAPNVTAAKRVINRILPFIRQDMPEATFHVVGRNPTVDLLNDDGIDGCHIWGRVDDVRPWLKAADIAIVPLDIARGVQNKVLEAMSMALPVVLTSGAATGLGANDGEHYAIADSNPALAAAALTLLRDRRFAAQRGAAARRFVTENASWQTALAALPELVGGPRNTARNAA